MAVIMTVNVFPGYEKQIVVPPEVTQDTWDSFAGYLYHKKNIKSTIHKKISDLKLNTLYEITYEVFDYQTCSVQLKVGTQQGAVRTSNGYITESFVVSTDSDRTLTFVSDGILKVRNLRYKEKQFNTEKIPFTDKTKFEDKSWTISYSFYDGGGWVGWHSYMPLYYVYNQNHFFSFIGNRNIWMHNIEGLFQKYYGINYPFIFEEVVTTNPIMTKTWEDLTILTKARKWDATEREYRDERFVTFNKMIAYTDRGSTGEVLLVVKDDMVDPTDWFFEQVKNVAGQIQITRKERNWNINELRDYVKDPAKPLFSASWSKRQNQYFIDKVSDQTNIDLNKTWDELEMLRDKFLVVRFIFDNFEDVNLILNYTLQTEQQSSR